MENCKCKNIEITHEGPTGREAIGICKTCKAKYFKYTNSDNREVIVRMTEDDYIGMKCQYQNHIKALKSRAKESPSSKKDEE